MVALLCTNSVVAGGDIRVFRDRNGVLNISNVPIPKARTLGQLERVTSPTPISSTPPPVTPTRIYAYQDAQGVRHFTNVPSTTESRYQLVLQAPLVSHSSVSLLSSPYEQLVTEAAQAYQVDPALVRAVIQAESAFNPQAVSPKGAIGLMQLMPDTARRYGVQDTFNPTDNVYGGVHYLRDLLVLFGHDLRRVVAAYNAGEGAVSRYGDVPPYPETTLYVERVLTLHQRYQQSSPPK